MTAAVPTFYLYGEARRPVDERFVHVEAVAERTAPAGWTIRTHAHPDLHHVFHVSAGGGTLHVDAATLAFEAPALLAIPACAVHGFQWRRGSAGTVLTLASSYFSELVRRDPDLADIFLAPAALPCGDGPEVATMLAALARELSWAAPGHRAATDARLLVVLVEIARLRGSLARSIDRPGFHAELVARLRDRIEQRFRLREPVQDHAAALGVSARMLRAACATSARQSPGDMLDQRTILEARRSLRYGGLSVAEIGYSLGFSDPAYFSRFFARRVGQPPSAFRRAARTGRS